MADMVKGIIPAMVTPFNEAGAMDETAIGRLVEKLVADGADGIYVAGSTGEAFLLSEEERVRCCAACVEAAAKRVPVIAHVGAISTGEACRLAAQAEKAGAAAVSACVPFYYKFTAGEVMRYYLDITARVALPMVCYNFPALTGFALDEEMLATMNRDNGRIMAVKNTSMDLFFLEKVKRKLPFITIYNGHDEVFLPSLSVGADGAIGSTFNFMAPVFKKILHHYAGGRWEEAAGLQADANAMIEALIKYGVNPSIKAILRELGVIGGACRPPFGTLDKAQIEALMEAYARHVQPHR